MSSPSPADRSAWTLWLVGPVFIAAAAWLALASPRAEIPRGEVHNVPREEIKPGAWRTPLKDATKAMVSGTVRPCSECHRLFAPSDDTPRTLVQHKDIAMHHGMNTRCLNCHDGADRDKLVLHNGDLVGFDQAPRLCSQCHGTVYRDWQRGVHGKTMGSWDASGGKQYRLMCNECHDPHAPAYKPMAPLPGPNTLRMGRQDHEPEPQTKHAPLRRWSMPSEGPGRHDAPDHSDQPADVHDPDSAEPEKEGGPS